MGTEEKIINAIIEAVENDKFNIKDDEKFPEKTVHIKTNCGLIIEMLYHKVTKKISIYPARRELQTEVCNNSCRSN